MKKPNRSEFGYSKKTGWQDERDRDLYDAALLKWYNRPMQEGKKRVHPIHESWKKALDLFDSTNPKRSQNAFCAWAGIKPATFSNWKNKPLLSHVENWILEWEYVVKGKEVENG